MKKQKRILMKGNEALAEAAIRAGCNAYFGYPITPQSELIEYMAKYLPNAGGVFIQAESEIAAISMVYGASSAGARVMTSSSGPGISLKQEGISYLAGAELPCVIVNVMRGGPGLGDIQPSQGDYFQATRGGGQGDYRTIVLAPGTVQEMADLTFLAFDLADKYRMPVVMLADGALGQMAEPVVFGDKPAIKLPPKDWALTGAKGRQPNRITPAFNLDQYVVGQINLRLQAKYDEIKKAEIRYELINMKNPDIVIVAFGTMARISKSVIDMAAKDDIRVGLIRPVTLWPFPYKAIQAIARIVGKSFLTVEMNLGQMVEDVKLAVGEDSPLYFYGRAGGIIPTAEEILEQIQKIRSGGGELWQP